MDISTPNIVESVLIFLVFLSIVIWAVGLSKYLIFIQHERADRTFLRHFAAISHISQLDNGQMDKKSRLSRVCNAGVTELEEIQVLEGKVSTDEKREILSHALQQQAHLEQARMENGLSILASVGSTAPFIGLFGTVWGIMNALKDITASGSASLDVVAGPIGEALIATAIGIATAVPAVLAYNYFLRKVRLSAATMDNFASAFQLLALKSGAMAAKASEREQ